jgi:hypothetical protein
MHSVISNPLAHASDEGRGAVYTRREVVEAMLDLIGYVPARPLSELTILEPCCGKGDFLLPIIGRLLESYRRYGGRLEEASTALKNSIRATEISAQSHREVSVMVSELLEAHGISASDAAQLTEAWLVHADFLLVPLPRGFDFVVGNPPYLRQERIPDALLIEYRIRFRTLYDRADIYVPFIERSLNLLKADGHLSFICSDRWMKNRYGGPLRSMVSQGFHLKHILSINDVPAFTKDVIAYPAIFVIENAFGNQKTKVAVPPKTLAGLKATVEAMSGATESEGEFFREMRGIVCEDHPWLTEANSHVSLIRRLEREYPTLEEAGCRVGIGVATGADAVFIGAYATLDVEEERKVPLVGTKDIFSGKVVWQGKGVVNPFEADGRIAELDRYPRFRKFVETNEVLLRRRNVAQRSGRAWYRTIDRIYVDLIQTPKLLIPDIKGEANVVYDKGNYYPHHNLYYVTSTEWDLRALQAVLRSHLSQLFIVSYSLRMQGGFLRYQAQYLRRIRLPKWDEVSHMMRGKLISAASSGDPGACNSATAELYQLDAAELSLLQTFQST